MKLHNKKWSVFCAPTVVFLESHSLWASDFGDYSLEFSELFKIENTDVYSDIDSDEYSMIEGTDSEDYSIIEYEEGLRIDHVRPVGQYQCPESLANFPVECELYSRYKM